jgi:coiled-coil domain-containing protein 6
VHKQVEQEEEFITNKLMKRLEQLKKEKQTLATEVEQEEEYLVNTLQKRLDKLNKEKVDLEAQLETEQEHITNQLHKKLAELTLEKHRLNLEKINLENQLEAEQEYIVNRLQKQVSRLAQEKQSLQNEKNHLQRTVTDLAGSVDRMNRDKVALEQAMEMEEEGIVNRLNRQLEALTTNLRHIESKLEARGISMQELGPLPHDPTNERRLYGRSPGKSGEFRMSGSRRERPTSASSTSSLPSDVSRADLLHASLRARSIERHAGPEMKHSKSAPLDIPAQ